MKPFVLFVLTWLSLASAITRLRRDDCTQNVVYQAHDPNLDTVVKVIARDSERLLILGNGTDYTSPCDTGLSWWLSHEVQGTATCKDSSGAAPASFLQTRRSDDGCPPCTPKVDSMGGYFKSVAALSVLTSDGRARKPRRVLVIGLGAGLLPSWLLANTEAEVDVVDINQAVVDASPCFGLRAGGNLALYADDGRKFLANAADATYDTIIVDAFDGSASMPMCMRSVEFFKLAAGKLTKRGVLLLNLLTCGSDKDAGSCGPFRDSVVAAVQQSFSTTYDAQAPGSLGSQSVLLAKKHDDGPEESAGTMPSEVAQGWFKEAGVVEVAQLNADLATHDAASC